MRQLISISGIIFTLAIFIHCGTKPPVSHTQNPPEIDWEQIDSLIEHGMMRTALEDVERIKRQLKSTPDKHPDKIKAALYYSRLKADTEDEVRLAYIELLREQKNQWSQPGRSILTYHLAKAYETYLQSNQWNIQDRSSGSKAPEHQPEYWSSDQFTRKISSLYLNALQWPGLKEQPIDSFIPLIKPIAADELKHISLYELLGHKAIEYFSSPGRYITKPTYAFIINDPMVFEKRSRFIDWEIQTRDTASFDLRVLRLFQNLSSQYGNSNSFPAILNDLDRLSFAHQQAEMDGKDSLYFSALQRLAQRAKDNPILATVLVRQASYLHSHPDRQNAWIRAVDLCDRAIASYPNSSGGKQAKNLKQEILKKELSIQMPQVGYPMEHILCKASWRNLDAFEWNIHAISEEQWEHLKRTNDPYSAFQSMDIGADTSGTVRLPGHEDHQLHEIEWGLPPMKSGFYILSASVAGEEKASRNHIQLFQVNPWSLTLLKDDQSNVLRVNDRQTGQPIPDATVQLHRYEREGYDGSVLQQFAEFTTDQTGIVTLGSVRNRNFRATVRKGQKVYICDEFMNTYRHRRGNERAVTSYFFTDRAIYRPGQSIYFKLLLTREGADKYPEIMANKSVRVTLRNANHQEVKTIQVKTNAYGSASSSFELPDQGLTGRFHLESSMGNNRQYIRVEEYKRPSFEVSLQQPTTSYSVGDTLSMQVKAANYAGNPVDGGSVRWKVVRERYIWRPYQFGMILPPGGREQRIIALGKGETNPDGTFGLQFPLIGGSNGNNRDVYHYTITTEVTDIQGETHSAERTIRASRTPYRFNLRHNERYAFKMPDSIAVQSVNWEGQGIPSTGQATLKLLKAPDRLLRERHWGQPDRQLMDSSAFVDKFPHDPYHQEHLWRNRPVEKTIQSVSFNTDEQGHYGWQLPQKLIPGVYRMTVEDQDRHVKAIGHFEYVPVESQNRTHELLTATLSKRTAHPGEHVRLQLSSGMDSLPINLRVKRMNRPVEMRRITVSGQREISIAVTDKDRGGISIEISGNALNRPLSKQVDIAVPWSEKKLDIQWTRIRDELLPGEQTEWSLQITTPEDSIPQAEFLATLYDASLDAIKRNRWSTPSKPQLTYRFNHQMTDYGTHRFNPIYFRPDYTSVTALSWPDFHQFLAYTVHYGAVDYRTPLIDSRAKQSQEADESVSASEEQEDEGENNEETIPPVRENFDETVFFFPQLNTDSSGSVTLNFKMNEALTRWRLMGFAHTKDLKMGRTEQEVVTNQDFMVFPNVPRFLREGDRIDISTKVTNQSDRTIQGKGGLKLTNLVTGEDISEQWIKGNAQPEFNIPGGRSNTIRWTLQIPEQFKGVLQIELFARAGQFTDGERHILPVVSRDMLVTETLPLPVGSNEQASFTFDGMEREPEGSSPHRFTLEFTPNPAWYAVKALPWLADPKSENSEQIFHQLFANELAAHIANSRPEIQNVFKLWEQDEDALESELLKNEELKQSLLEETPWVMDAMRETEQRQQIAQLFDPNQIEYARSEALDKLQQLQLRSGGFPWFKGGRDNFYISLLLLEGLGRLSKLGLVNQDNQVQRILNDLIPYCDREAVEWFEQHGNKSDTDLPAYILLQYLKARSLFDSEHPLPDQTGSLTQKVFGQISNRWQDLNLYGQGMASLIMHRYEIGQVASDILASITERALYDDELGMYWRDDNGYHWYQHPVERHVLLMQCFHEMHGADSLYEQQRIWLLKQKQTQHWETSKSTASAVYALLMRGEDWLSEQQEVAIRLGGKEIKTDPSDAEAGTGYFKKSWEARDIKPEFSHIEVDNPNDHIAWGAAYYQYFAPMDQVRSSEGEGWSIDKTYYQLETTAEGEQRLPITGDNPLEVGEKVLVRLEVRTDRSVNYVHLKDMRVSGMEPIKQKSGYQWSDGVGYYLNPRDMAMHFFFDYLPKGTYVFEYELYARQSGTFSAGTAGIQCYYAPEFSAHSSGKRVSIEE